MRLPSSKFTYTARTRTFSAFASDLPRPFLERIYSDAQDLGFEMVSAKTSAAAKFYLVKEDSDPDLGTFSWQLLPDEASVHRHPSLRGTSVIIFND